MQTKQKDAPNNYTVHLSIILPHEAAHRGFVQTDE